MIEKDLRTHIMETITAVLDNVADLPRDNDADYEEYKTSRAMWENMAADRILAGFVDFLPPPVDMEGKYEVKPYSGIYIKLSEKRDHRDSEWDGSQLDFLAKYADDTGYNRYHLDLLRSLERLYKTGERVI